MLPWPSCSPDINPIEHVWDVIGRKVRARGPRNVRDLERMKNATDSRNVSAMTTLRRCAADAEP